MNILYPEFKHKLDYTDIVNNIKKKTDAQELELNKKIDEYSKLENQKDDNQKDMGVFKSKINLFKDKLLKFQMSIMNLENSVQNIVPVVKTETKYYLGNIEIKNQLQLKQIAMRLSQDPNNNQSLEQIYNSLQSRLKTVTKETIEPSNNFKISLMEQKNKLIPTKKDISLTLEEVRDFKREFQSEYNDYLSSTEFYEYYSEIEALEEKLINQKNKTDLLNSKIDKSIIENDKKIAEINKMNLEKQKEQKLEEQQQRQQTQQRQNNNNSNQPNNNLEQHPQQNFIPNSYANAWYEAYMNQMHGMDEELEQTKGRSR